MFYAVLTDTAASALAIVRDSIPPNDDAELAGDSLSPETVKAIGLRPGYAHLL